MTLILANLRTEDNYLFDAGSRIYVESNVYWNPVQKARTGIGTYL
jgi:hypothetical protein